MSRRSLIAAVVVTSWIAGSTLGSIAGLPAAIARTPGIVIGRAHGGYTPELTGGGTITILAVGSDARPGQNPLTSRADSIHVIFLQPRKGQAVIVGIPRDSWVSIPGYGTNKINSAMSSGGPARLVQTIEQNFGARIDYWAVTSFWGIERMVDQVGGLKVRVPFEMHDSFSGANFHRGLKRLNGKQVLAFARDRHSVASGDFGRQENGGRVFESALFQFRTEYRRNPSRLLTWIAAGVRNMDTELSVEELVELAFTASHVRQERVRNVVLPGGTGSVGGLSVVTLSMSAARAIFADAKVDGALRRGNVPRSPTGTG
jgi:polyisoprenyl-teichoic acid--peptidoglycan teichoic acid transferase